MKEMLKNVIAARCKALGVRAYEEEMDGMADALVSATWLSGGADINVPAAAVLVTLGLLEIRQVGDYIRYVPCYTQVG